MGAKESTGKQETNQPEIDFWGAVLPRALQEKFDLPEGEISPQDFAIVRRAYEIDWDQLDSQSKRKHKSSPTNNNTDTDDCGGTPEPKETTGNSVAGGGEKDVGWFIYLHFGSPHLQRLFKTLGILGSPNPVSSSDDLPDSIISSPPSLTNSTLSQSVLTKTSRVMPNHSVRGKRRGKYCLHRWQRSNIRSQRKSNEGRGEQEREPRKGYWDLFFAAFSLVSRGSVPSKSKKVQYRDFDLDRAENRFSWFTRLQLTQQLEPGVLLPSPNNQIKSTSTATTTTTTSSALPAKPNAGRKGNKGKKWKSRKAWKKKESVLDGPMLRELLPLIETLYGKPDRETLPIIEKKLMELGNWSIFHPLMVLNYLAALMNQMLVDFLRKLESGYISRRNGGSGGRRSNSRDLDSSWRSKQPAKTGSKSTRSQRSKNTPGTPGPPSSDSTQLMDADLIKVTLPPPFSLSLFLSYFLSSLKEFLAAVFLFHPHDWLLVCRFSRRTWASTTSSRASPSVTPKFAGGPMKRCAGFRRVSRTGINRGAVTSECF